MRSARTTFLKSVAPLPCLVPTLGVLNTCMGTDHIAIFALSNAPSLGPLSEEER